MNTLAIANQKGGVGKTTTAINVAAWMAAQGRRVLVLDMDGQGHVAQGLGGERTDGLYRWLVRRQGLGEVVAELRERLWVLANDHTVELVKEHVKGENFREYVLVDALAEVEGQFDLVVIDTPPSTDVLHVLALVASEMLVIPANMDYLAVDGVGMMLRTLRSLGRYPGVTAPELVGVLPTMFDRQTGETLSNLADLARELGAERVLPPVPRDVKLREASAHGQTIWEYAPRCAGAVGYPAQGKDVNSAGRTGGYLHVCEIVAKAMG